MDNWYYLLTRNWASKAPLSCTYQTLEFNDSWAMFPHQSWPDMIHRREGCSDIAVVLLSVLVRFEPNHSLLSEGHSNSVTIANFIITVFTEASWKKNDWCSSISFAFHRDAVHIQYFFFGNLVILLRVQIHNGRLLASSVHNLCRLKTCRCKLLLTLIFFIESGYYWNASVACISFPVRSQRWLLSNTSNQTFYLMWHME